MQEVVKDEKPKPKGWHITSFKSAYLTPACGKKHLKNKSESSSLAMTGAMTEFTFFFFFFSPQVLSPHISAEVCDLLCWCLTDKYVSAALICIINHVKAGCTCRFPVDNIGPLTIREAKSVDLFMSCDWPEQ